MALLAEHAVKTDTMRASATKLRHPKMSVGAVDRQDTGRALALNPIRLDGVLMVEVAIGEAPLATTRRISSSSALFRLVTVADKLAIM